MPPQPTTPSRGGPTAFLHSLSSRLNIHAALAGEEEHLLNSIWILLMFLEAFIVVVVTIRSVYRTIRMRVGRSKKVISSRPGTGYSARSGTSYSRRASGGERGLGGWESEKDYVLGEKDWILDGVSEFSLSEKDYYGGNGRFYGSGNRGEKGQWNRTGGYPVTP
ncbi:hypothetical protein QBC43DRAFT_288852 [Cladorrhinum sp. PSN259]|nr:hypothetical protein QBC43DRAFT_288852 [Cladorrhinum sp. PSN259]